ncbi:MAG: hypothetical protein R2735_09440 [Microthrixaceae bacterium]
MNLPEVVKGALFARYSRSPKSLRRLFLDEFVGELDIAGDETIDATIGLARAEALYDRVFFEYGDDSVAQLGGVHLACEQASNLLTKVLEWGRLMSCTRSSRLLTFPMTSGPVDGSATTGDPEILASGLGARYVGDMDRLFTIYGALAVSIQDYFREQFPKAESDSDFVYRQAIRAKAYGATRGILPSAALSNEIGIYQFRTGFESLILHMKASPLPEANSYADLILTELRKVIPVSCDRLICPSVAVRGPTT